MDKLDLVIDMIKEVRSDVKENNSHLAEMKVEVELNRKDLEEHMAQTRAVRSLAQAVRDEANTRIEIIEKKLTIGYLFKLIVTVASGVGAVSGAIYAVTRLL